MNRRVSLVATSAALALALALPAQGDQGNGKGKGHKSTPPSQSALPSPTVSGGAAGGAAPLAEAPPLTVGLGRTL